MSILGNRVRRVEDPKFLTVGGTYVADLRDPALEGALHVTYVRSTMAHALIGSIEVGDALTAPGVVAIYTAPEIDLDPLPSGVSFPEATRPWLATDRVRYVGEPVVAIVSETAAQGVDAAEQIWVDYEPLQAVVDPEQAAVSDVHLFPGAGTNIGVELEFGVDPALLDACEVVVRQRIVNQRVAPCPLEVRGAATAWVEGRLVMWVSTQDAHGVRASLVDRYGLEVAQIRVVAPDVGGGFGAKIGAGPEELLLPWIARQLGRPVRWHETRSDSMVGMVHGRAQVQHVELGGTRDGKLQAYRLTVTQDTGAYGAVGAFLPYMTRLMTTGVYDIPKAEFSSRSVMTNTTPIGAYRGAGRPEATAAIERAVDLFAAEVGLDPAELRRRNLVAADAFPYTNATGTVYDCGDYPRALELVLDAAGYAELRAEQARRRAAGDPVALGIGLATYVEITAGPNADVEHATVEVRLDGSAVVYTGSSPHGQGHHTGFSMLASEALGIPMDRITVVHGDTDLVPEGVGTYGSRSLQLGGSAVRQAAVELVDIARQRAADRLEANVDDVVLDAIDGRFHVAGTPARGVTWADLAGDDGADELRVATTFQAASPTFPFGAHLAVVEVDTETGRVDLRRMVAVDDAGRVLNPLLLEGQIHGGLAQGVAQALYEEVRYDDDGNPITANFADYSFPSAAELPSFELTPMETPTWVNPLGAKGVGESGSIGSTPAIQNAVCDVLAYLGVQHVDMPCTAERVWRAIQGASA